MSVLAIGIAALGMLATVIPAARITADGALTRTRHGIAPVLFVVIRAAYIFSRAVPELVWAMLIVFIFSPGILPGAIALGIHNFGVLGKLCAEVVEDLDLRPARAVRAAGASSAQTLLYAVLPSALPQFLTYILYRWEVIIRTTIVVGFVSAAGLGREFRLRMSFFHYTDVALLLLVYFLLVLSVDLLSTVLRRLAR
ncbi:MAG: ABC transporter permease subunit [Chloroflexi bacterium]|nr:ABC transporter permease subunit [Chloroflexota bacterium]